ncbi:MAG: hypothetical protein ACR2K0_02520 [Acidimicrobiales bacterium]
MSVVWECGSCATRSLERRCDECNLFCSRIGAGGECPGCGELVAADELEGTDAPDHPVIGVDVLDAYELSEVLDYIGEWLADASAAVTTSLEDHGGGPGAREILLDALARHSRSLTTRVAS